MRRDTSFGGIAVMLAALVAVAACSRAMDNRQPSLEEDRTAVYAAILAFWGERYGRPVIALSSQTYSEGARAGSLSLWINEIPGFSHELADQLERRLSVSRPLNISHLAPPALVVVHEEPRPYTGEFRSYLSAQYGYEFLFELSDVAFSEDRTRAAVMRGDFGLILIMLSRGAEGWKVDRQYGLVVP